VFENDFDINIGLLTKVCALSFVVFLRENVFGYTTCGWFEVERLYSDSRFGKGTILILPKKPKGSPVTISIGEPLGFEGICEV